VLCGEWAKDWRGQRAEGDFYILKGIVQTLAARLLRQTVRLTREPQRWTDLEQGTVLYFGEHRVGAAGCVPRAATEALDIKQPVWAAELSVDELLKAEGVRGAVQAPPAFPPVKRDLSLFVKSDTLYEAVHRAILDVVGASAGRVELIDRFDRGAQIPPGTYSLTFAIEYRHPSRTLTAAEADELHQRVGRTLVERVGASLR
jgi:phenylalanyl-tRNA synthetase beta chain